VSNHRERVEGRLDVQQVLAGEGAQLLRFRPGWAELESRPAGAGRVRVRLQLALAGGVPRWP
jgi:hypothetical protein